MKTFPFFLSLLLSAAPLAAQTPVALRMPSGVASGVQANDGSEVSQVWSEIVHVADAASVQLHFSAADLGGDEDLIVVTGLEDGESQRLDRLRLSQWRNQTAIFNGSSVEIRLFLAPGSRGSVVVESVVAGMPGLGAPDSVCGTDSRTLSTDVRVCRLVITATQLSAGCTGWLIDDSSTILTAGHCHDGTSFLVIAEFNVPISATNGNIAHPPVADQYPVDLTSIQFRNTGVGDDWAVARLHPNSTGQTAFDRQGAVIPLATSLPAFLPGFGPTLRITGNGTDATPNATRNGTQQTATGPLTTMVGDILNHTVDTEPGNSGSPILLESSGQAIGIHTNGGCDLGPLSANAGTSILNVPLQTAIQATIGCQRVALIDGLSVGLTCASVIFDTTPGASRWTAVAVSASNDWNVDIEGTASATSGSVCDFLLANGHNGSVPPISGRFSRQSGTATGRGQMALARDLAVNQPVAVSWSSTRILDLFEVPISATGTYAVSVQGDPSLAWRLYTAGTNASWRPRSSATLTASGTAGGAVTALSLPAGWHVLVVTRDGGPASLATNLLTVSVCQGGPTLALAATTPVATTTDCHDFTVSPVNNTWSVVAVSSTSDWNVLLGGGVSNATGNSADFGVANGTLGTGTPLSGIVHRVSGFTSATVEFAPSLAVAVSAPFDTSLTSGRIIRPLSVSIPSPGNYDVIVTGGGGDSQLFWRLFAPGSGPSWRGRGDSIASGTVGAAIPTTASLGTGSHLLVVYRNAGTSSGSPLTVHICPNTTPLLLDGFSNLQVVANVCQPFALSAAPTIWTAIAITSDSDWDLAIGPVESQASGPVVDMLVADGRAGPVSPLQGIVNRQSGSSTARLQRMSPSALLLGVTSNQGLIADHVLRMYEFDVPSTGSYDLTLTGATDLVFHLFAPPGDPTWRNSSSALVAGAVGSPPLTGLALTPGWHALVVSRSGAPAASTSVFTVHLAPTAQPTPSLTTLSPNGALAGSGAFTLTVNGAQFLPSTTVQWSGQSLPTTYVNGTTLEVSVSPSQVASAGTATITAATPAPGGGVSNGLSFVVSNPTPVASILIPNAAVVGATPSAVILTGTGFVGTSVVRWNGAPLPTTVLGPTQLQFTPPPGAFATTGAHDVTVVIGGPGGGTSNGLTFFVDNPAPGLLAINPTSVVAGGNAFVLTVSGFGFQPSSVVRWNTRALAVISASPTFLTAQVPPALIALAGTASITVQTPSPGGGTSIAIPLSIANPAPILGAVLPNTLPAGAPSAVITLTGSGFVSASQASLQGVTLLTTLLAPTALSVSVPGSLLATPGTKSLRVQNPAPGGGLSNLAAVNIVSPSLTTILPPIIAVQAPGTSAIPITLSGAQFVPGVSQVVADGFLPPILSMTSTQIVIALDPDTVIGCQRPGGITLTVANTTNVVSNSRALLVGPGGSNQGTIRRTPLIPNAGQAYSLKLEGGAPSALFSIFVDLENPPPLVAWPDPSADLVLSVGPLVGSGALFFPVLDGLGLYGPALGVTYDANGNFTFPGFAQPTPPFGIDLTVQGVYLDPTAPLGFRLTWARFPDRL